MKDGFITRIQHNRKWCLDPGQYSATQHKENLERKSEFTGHERWIYHENPTQ